MLADMFDPIPYAATALKTESFDTYELDELIQHTSFIDDAQAYYPSYPHHYMQAAYTPFQAISYQCLPVPLTRTTTEMSDSSACTDHDQYCPPRKLCAVFGCHRNVRSKGFCKRHGGGKQCCMHGCVKEAQNGNYCIGHGGGKCCKIDGCSNAAQSQGLCKAHGGGAAARRRFLPLHGGGKRCLEPGCTKGAQRGNKCAKHGGCRTCTVDDCVRTDRGGGLCEIPPQGQDRLGKTMGMCTPHVREFRNKFPTPSL
ncbi:hypothetical protein SPRG_01584 [Saprolegnia parasitica CBS 223.65]|uniref:WRKY19-like zinc finger domain-containing protein n=1 Tax=Saprolegnia parasitica (strain CBS 223.65) TaxID=695850 RepID=A0A067CYV3_SAPPC|nr:hypothetical protein SPRG_01584 [Saprolegnia parasitica CBS 223.65]KDO34450.1 hypothetical protein SPRG_01584 [Saprolegnia parasitica CBS 223.65]|eukprot:XP_012195180.1 hypothetical protein SPRG_01584 [Saprolegnia parasitica CBS 223.65]